MLLALAGSADAKKKPKPPPAPPPPPAPDTTTVCFKLATPTGYELWTMDGNGGSKAQTGVSLCGDATTYTAEAGQPTHATHGGHHWFVRLCPVSGTYPDGYEQHELFAVRDDGLSVQLTNDWTFAHPKESMPTWKSGDGAVSFVGLRWSSDGSTVTQAGIYEAPVQFDANGDVTGLGRPPVLVLGSTVSLRGNGAYRTELIGSHDWSPTADPLVFVRQGGLASILVVGTGTEAFLTNGTNPDWSPDGNKIALPQNGIITVDPNGSGLSTVVANVVKKRSWVAANLPIWDSDSARLLYRRITDSTSSPGYADLYKVNADGSGNANLTGDVAGDVRPVAWR